MELWDADLAFDDHLCVASLRTDDSAFWGYGTEVAAPCGPGMTIYFLVEPN